MTDLLRLMIDLRDSLQKVQSSIREYGFTEAAPEVLQMQKLERKLFAKVNKWDKP